MNLNDRVTDLENQVRVLLAKIQDLSQNTEEKYIKPITISGGVTSKAFSRPADIQTGMGLQGGGAIVWNDSELKNPPANAEPDSPTVGYNKHSHSRYSGGALIKDMLEIVEYTWGSIVNKHSQQYWVNQPSIAKAINTNGESVEKIGALDLVFDPDTRTWGTTAHELDIKKCFFVERDANGDIALDSKGQEKKSLLYNEDITKTSIIWDENANCWRLFSAYAPGNE